MSDASFRALAAQGRQALRGNNPAGAIHALLQASQDTTAREGDYREALGDLRAAYVALGAARGVLSLDWYTGDARAQATAIEHVAPYDRARTLQSWGALEGPGSAHYTKAAEQFEQIDLLAHAAVCRERADDFSAAKGLWSRLAATLARTDHDHYAGGLAQFNVARCSQKLGHNPLAAMVSSVHLLEEAADHFTQCGQRERAFDCYQVLIAVGKQSGMFEHILEGYVNVVRILREDNLRYYALQQYEDSLVLAEGAGEFTAGATLAKEMANYARTEGMMPLAGHADARSAQLWERVATAVITRGSPAEMAENALLAAVVTYARARQFADVGRVYTLLSQLDLEPRRKDHYARASKRYTQTPNAAVDIAPLASHLRQQDSLPEVWHVDLVEWEQHGSASAACAEVLLERDARAEPMWPEVIRRRALVARLAALQIEDEAGVTQPERLAGLVDLLGAVELYTMLGPLEHLFQNPATEVRVAVVRALTRCPYKRTFVTIRAALDDHDPTVAQQAYQTIKALPRFNHALDPLARIYRESPTAAARTAALSAIARIDSRDAAELLVGVFQYDGSAERKAAALSLRSARANRTFFELAREAAPTLASDARSELEEVFRARGEVL